jgi:hypothetical protein
MAATAPPQVLMPSTIAVNTPFTATVSNIRPAPKVSTSCLSEWTNSSEATLLPLFRYLLVKHP